MAKITYVECNGTEHMVDVPIGDSVMQGAVKNNVPGIDADCGGACACATCHVYVDPGWLGAVGAASSDTEASMLEYAAEPVEANSRLSCQVQVTAELDGLIVRMPRRQH
jgi:2Fe-2S ferredoxin